MKNSIFVIIALTIMTFGFACTASAQKGKLFKGVDWKKMAADAKAGKTSVDQDMIARIDAAFDEKSPEVNEVFGSSLVGTWYVTVPGPTPEETFYAYHTFGLDGTFVETSSLLISLTEGPAHGVWERRFNGNVLTFELFAFDPETSTQVGRVRVRCFIRPDGRNGMTAETAVDFIDLDGTVTPNIATGPFSGQRVQLRGLN